MFSIDYSVSLGNIITIFSVVGSVIALLYNMKGDITIVKHDINYLQKSHEALTEAFAQLGKVLTQVAVQDQRISTMEKHLYDLSHSKNEAK